MHTYIRTCLCIVVVFKVDTTCITIVYSLACTHNHARTHSLSLSHARTHARTHGHTCTNTRMHIHTYKRTNARTRLFSFNMIFVIILYMYVSLSLRGCISDIWLFCYHNIHKTRIKETNKELSF